jgi:hypothetical protein
MSKISNVIKNKETIFNCIEDKNQKEMVHHPDHYDMADKTYEPYKVINAWGANFNIGNAIKYLARYKKKWNPIEDLEKAKQYIDFEIECLKTGSDVIDVMNKQLKEAVKDIDFKLSKE